jgi:hypothetical protein
MKPGTKRFNFYLEQAGNLMDNARKEKNPAMWLFSNNARTPFFMLEALARLYGGLHNKKSFEKLKNRFKVIEDGLGQIDYHNSLIAAFESNSNITPEIIEFVKGEKEKSALLLNEVLVEEKWLSAKGSRIMKISGKLKNLDWMNPEKEAEEIGLFYKDEIGKVKKFVDGTKYIFDNVEEDVHELRRKLRWLSIYPQAMLGAFQFDADSPGPRHLDKYMTKAIIESPFNKLPQPGDNTSFIILNKKYFLALSWMIAKLGDLKDEGLLMSGLAHVIRQTTGFNDKDAQTKAILMWKAKPERLQQILDEAEELTKRFFSEKNTDRLLVKVIKASKKIKKITGK